MMFLDLSLLTCIVVGPRNRLTERGVASNEVAVSLLEITQRLGAKPDFTE
ncbi:hypothetical protein H4S14_003157, partial [Agrobacterium vitis]|nr:hypothetical protein [Agrobacterium vitis]